MTALLPLWGVAALYLGQGLIEAHRGNWPGATILAGYVLANFGLVWSFSK